MTGYDKAKNEPPASRGLRFHHMRQVPVAGLNQTFRLFRPFGRGIGIVVLRHEFTVSVR
jgi:hypothetical protein